MVHQIMLATGESAVLPALLFLVLLFLVLYPVSIWVLLNIRNGKRSGLITACAIVIATVGGVGALLTLKGSQWPPEWGDIVGFLLWLFPPFCGLLVIARVRNRKDEGKS